MLSPEPLDIRTLLFVCSLVSGLSALLLAAFVWRVRRVPWLAWLAGADALIALALGLAWSRGTLDGRVHTGSFEIWTVIGLMLLILLKDVGFLLATLRKQFDDAEQQSRTDPLTGLFNRRVALEQGMIEFERARRQHVPLSAIMVDIDHFKAINDGFGHRVGDLVLVHMGRLLSTHTRRFDLCARFGGEEFLIFLPGTPLSTAVLVAEKLRTALAGEAWPEVNGRRVTASFGVAAYGGHDSLQELVESSDRALQAAKEAGRNCVESVAI